jgi:hypothetical protein
VDEKFTETVPDLPKDSVAVDTSDTEELPTLALHSTHSLRKYAKSFLRFYRARRILSGNRNINTVTRERALYAWKYLASLAPNELPPSLREVYREIFALAYLLDRETEFQSPVEFVSKILQITTSIDEMVDDLLLDSEKPPANREQ